MNKKKILWISLGALDLAIVVFLFVIHIIMLAIVLGGNVESYKAGTGFISYLINHTTFYGCVFVIPLFVLLALNIVGLVLYMKKTTKKKAVTVNDLTDEEKEALKKELLKDLEDK